VQRTLDWVDVDDEQAAPAADPQAARAADDRRD
jgi:hypothetical protein